MHSIGQYPLTMLLRFLVAQILTIAVTPWIATRNLKLSLPPSRGGATLDEFIYSRRSEMKPKWVIATMLVLAFAFPYDAVGCEYCNTNGEYGNCYTALYSPDPYYADCVGARCCAHGWPDRCWSCCLGSLCYLV